MNKYGFEYMPNAKADVVDYSKVDTTGDNAVHSRWKEEADEVVMDSLKNNKDKDLIMRGYVPSTITYNAKDESEYKRGVKRLISRRKLTGGVITTQEGQTLINDKLQQRINQLNQLQASAWGSPTKSLSSVLPPPPTSDFAPFENAMVSLVDAVQTGAINSDLIEAVNKANSSLIQVGAVIPPTKIADYIQINSNIYYSILSLLSDLQSAGKFSLSAERKRILETLKKSIKRQEKLLYILNDNVYESVPSKQMLLQAEREKLIPKAIESLKSEGALGLSALAQRKLLPPTQPMALKENLRTTEAKKYLSRMNLPPPPMSESYSQGFRTAQAQEYAAKQGSGRKVGGINTQALAMRNAQVLETSARLRNAANKLGSRSIISGGASLQDIRKQSGTSPIATIISNMQKGMTINMKDIPEATTKEDALLKISYGFPVTQKEQRLAGAVNR
jgi:hypothetical protein